MPEKSYSRCIDCEHIGKKCGGPDFIVMEAQKLSEWCRLRKEYLHKSDPKWTNAYVSKQADVSLTTVNRFFAGDIEDTKLSTAARILRVLVNGTWGQYPCLMVGNDSTDPAAEAECLRLREQVSSERAKIEYLKQQVAFQERQLVQKDEVIDERGDFAVKQSRDIRILSALLGVCVVVVIAALVVDLLNPDIGFFWVSR